MTFTNVGRWLEDVKKHGDPNMVFCLVGNKCDLAEQSRKVNIDDAKQYASQLFSLKSLSLSFSRKISLNIVFKVQNNMSFIETSALDSTNVEKAFVNLIKGSFSLVNLE